MGTLPQRTWSIPPRSGLGMLVRQMTFNFSERRVHFERRLRGVVYGTARAAVKLDKKLHMKLRRTLGEPQLTLFFNLL